MASSANRRAPTVTGFAVNCAITALRKRNIDPRPLLHRAGLSKLDFDDPQVRAPAAGLGQVLELAAEAMDDATFGLHLAEQTNPRDAGLLFYVSSAARNLEEALALLLRYSQLVNESRRLKLARQAERLVVEFDYSGVSRQRVRQNTEFWIGMLIRGVREVTGREIRPLWVACPHVRNQDLREFERFYGCPVAFGAPLGQLAFANDILALPLITEDARLLEMLRPFCEEAARACRTAEGSLRASVENEVQRLLLQGQVSAESVARALAVSVRTLSRRLSEERTSFAEVVDQLRQSLALQYLSDPGMKSAQIAWLLGYEDPTSFNHAFKRWTGRSPSAARVQNRLSTPI